MLSQRDTNLQSPVADIAVLRGVVRPIVERMEMERGNAMLCMQAREDLRWRPGAQAKLAALLAQGMIKIGKGFDQEVELPARRFRAMPMLRLEDI